MYEQMRELFIGLGIPGEAIKRASYPKVEVIGVYRIKEIPKIAYYLYKNATIYMERKKKTFEKNNYL